MAFIPFVGSAATDWDLDRDFRVSPNQANPNPDISGTPNVWHFLQSTSLTHDPSTYTLLPQFISDTFFIQGLEQWQTTIPSGLADPKNSLPAVGLNATGMTKTFIGIVWPAGAIRMHPSQRLAIVGWQSPINGRVGITGSFSDLDSTCGGGVSWFIDQGSLSLTSGSFASGGMQNFNLTNVSVSQSGFVYFLVDPRGPSETSPNDFGCDSTRLDLNIVLQALKVAIDIKPGSDPNSVNLGSSGVIPVAILSSATFDATTVDPDSVTLAGAKVRVVGKSGRHLCHNEDVNGDLIVDMVCQVETADLFIVVGDASAVLEAKTTSGLEIFGEDSISIVP
jgi:hypothetical protein